MKMAASPRKSKPPSTPPMMGAINESFACVVVGPGGPEPVDVMEGEVEYIIEGEVEDLVENVVDVPIAEEKVVEVLDDAAVEFCASTRLESVLSISKHLTYLVS